MNLFQKILKVGLVWLALIPVSWSSSAVPANQVLVGKGVYTVLFWEVYQAELFAESRPWQSNQEYSLTLTYLRNFEGKAIAQRSVEEIRGLGFQDEQKLKSWLEVMLEIFPDVVEGESLTGVRQASGSTAFFKDGEAIGRIEDPEFSRWFFGIWLDENTSAPQLRLQLLGQS